MKNAEKIIMQDSPEAAELRTVTGWVSRHGRFYGDNEGTARYDGCTHVACQHCGAPTERGWTACEACRAKSADDRYEAMPRKAWDGEAMLYSWARDEYYLDMDGAHDALEEGQTLADLQLVICEPNRGRLLDEDYFADEVAEDCELPECLLEAIGAFNEAIKKAPPLSWSPGKFALDLTDVEPKQLTDGGDHV